MPIEDFIAQLRTYVIAMGLSPMVVDCVDNLCGADELEHEHAKELEELEDKTAKETKDDILKAVEAWFDKEDMPLLKVELVAVIKEVV